MKTNSLNAILAHAHLGEYEEQRIRGAQRIAATVSRVVLAIAHSLKGLGANFSAKPSYWH